MRLWSAWMPDLVPHLSGCAIALVEHELRRAAQAFFQGSRAWRVTLAPVAVAAGTVDIAIAPSDAETSLVRVEQCWYDGAPLDVKTAEELTTNYGDDWGAHLGTPTSYLQETSGIVRLYPIPDTPANTGLKVRASVMPSDISTGIPDDQAIAFREELATGAKARLMLYPNKPWTNAELGVAYAAAFKSATDTANVRAARSFGRGAIRSTPGWC